MNQKTEPPFDGKAPADYSAENKSSMNAFKWGFFSKKALLPGESWEEFAAFGHEMIEQLCPRNSAELHVIQQYISLAWRVKRLPEIEAGIFARYGILIQGNQCGSAFAMVANLQEDDVLGQLARYEATLRKGMFKYLDLLRTLRKDGWGAAALELTVEAVSSHCQSGKATSTPDASDFSSAA